jgi:hypothetical protein
LNLKGCCFGWNPKVEELREDAGAGWRVICYGCVTQVRGDTKDRAIIAWQARAALQSLDERTDRD